jgi:hypothetical protein
MKIQVKVGSGTVLTYEWTGDPTLVLGDKVHCPPAWWERDFRPEGKTGTVIALTSDYSGSLVSISKIVERNSVSA